MEVMVVETRCTPTVENVTAKTPLPTMRPKLTMKLLGENVAAGSVEFKITVYDPLSNPQATLMLPDIGTPRGTTFGAAVVGAGAAGHEVTPGST